MLNLANKLYKMGAARSYSYCWTVDGKQIDSSLVENTVAGSTNRLYQYGHNSVAACILSGLETLHYEAVACRLMYRKAYTSELARGLPTDCCPGWAERNG